MKGFKDIGLKVGWKLEGKMWDDRDWVCKIIVAEDEFEIEEGEGC